MPIIIIIMLAAYFILIAWTWQSLGDIEKKKKIAFIILGILVLYIVTLIIFNISKNGINYQNEFTQKMVKRILITLFTSLNGIVFMPYVAKIYYKIKENEIKKESLNKKIILFIIIFVICIFFEYVYLKDTQKGIISIYNSMMK